MNRMLQQDDVTKEKRIPKRNLHYNVPKRKPQILQLTHTYRDAA